MQRTHKSGAALAARPRQRRQPYERTNRDNELRVGPAEVSCQRIGAGRRCLLRDFAFGRSRTTSGNDQDLVVLLLLHVHDALDSCRTIPAPQSGLRAILKANDSAAEPGAARFPSGVTSTLRLSATALDALKQLPCSPLTRRQSGRPLRFYGVRLHELGMIKSTPQKLISQGTDWRFLNELKKELKA